MRPTTLKSFSTRLLASTAIAALFAGAPVNLTFDPDTALLKLQATPAQAKDDDGDDDGDSDGGGDGGGDSDGGGGDSDGGDSGGSDGDGGGDDHDDSGSGSDDDGDDGDDGDDDHDNSGSGSDDDDDDDDSGSGSDDDDDDDDDEDDDSGSGSDDDDDDDDDSGTESVSDGSGAKVEIAGNNIEITYPDGTKEEIEGGVYERKDANGETIEERPATQTDRDRLAAAATALGASATAEREFTRPDGTKVEVTGDNIEVEFANGWKEEIEDGRFEMKDPNGNTVVERPATDADRTRLEGQIPG